MFWVWFEWMVFAKPYNFDDDGETIKLNKQSKRFWVDMPPKYQGMATVIEVIMENE